MTDESFVYSSGKPWAGRTKLEVSTVPGSRFGSVSEWNLPQQYLEYQQEATTVVVLVRVSGAGDTEQCYGTIATISRRTERASNNVMRRLTGTYTVARRLNKIIVSSKEEVNKPLCSRIIFASQHTCLLFTPINIALTRSSI